jgi:hypothetical protein
MIEKEKMLETKLLLLSKPFKHDNMILLDMFHHGQYVGLDSLSGHLNYLN